MQKTTSNPTANSGLHNLPEREEVKGDQKKTVPVAEFRRGYDQLWRLANSDYCACVNLNEREGWLAIAERIMPEVAAMTCKRASSYDLEQQRSSVERMNERMAAVRVEIAADDAQRNTKH